MTKSTLENLYPDNDEHEIVITDLCNSADLIDSWLDGEPVDPDLLRYMVMSLDSLLHKVESSNIS